MAQFNTIKDLIRIDPLMESNTLSTEQIESLKSKFEETIQQRNVFNLRIFGPNSSV